MTEIITALAIAAFVDLFLDVNLFGNVYRSRDRRILFLLSLFARSFIRAFTYPRVGSTFALLISAIRKLIVTVAFILNKKIDLKEDLEAGNL